MKTTQLLDRRRAQNIEIMLRSLPREVTRDRLAEVICTAMPRFEPKPEPEPEPESQDCDETAAAATASRLKRLVALEERSPLTVDDLLSISAQFPTSDELKKVYRHVAATRATDSKSGSDLPPAETFVQTMGAVRRLESKLAVVVFAQQFDTHATSLLESLQLATSACSDIRNCDQLKRVMQLVLQLGNALNAGRGRPAAAFHLGSLLRLADTRSVDNKTTLLRVLADVAARSAPGEELVRLGVALPQLLEAHRLHMSELRSQLKHLLQGAALAKREATEAASNAHLEEDPRAAEATLVFGESAKVFGVVASDACDALELAMQELDVAVNSLAKFFMLDRSNRAAAVEEAETMEYILQTIFQFVKQLEQAHEQNVAEAAAEEEKKRRKEEAGQRGSVGAWGVSHDSLAKGVSLPRAGRDTGISASGQVEGGVLAEAMKARRGILHSDLTSASQPRRVQQAPKAVQSAIEKTVRGQVLRQPTSGHERTAGEAHDGAPEWSDDEWAAE
ncbi:FH2 domain-containing protein [bacterium]|nr:FH2 domain-containing protein [bacterium]